MAQFLTFFNNDAVRMWVNCAPHSFYCSICGYCITFNADFKQFMEDLKPFFEESYFNDDNSRQYHSLQWGANINYAFSPAFDVAEADIILVGCNEWRGAADGNQRNGCADVVRQHLYELYHWHPGFVIADMGNIRQGARLGDSRAALAAVLKEIEDAGKIAIILGGSHDLTLQQYEVFRSREQLAEAVVADMLIDLNENEETTDGSFLMDMLTNTPNFIAHYSHIGFQSYYAQPRMLETLDKLRFDFHRVGKVKENIDDMEPVLRSANFFSFDISAVKYADAPANINGSPNGLSGEEACVLTRFAGMSSKLTSLGIYGYDHATDAHDMTAKLITQMIWYFVDGLVMRRCEADLADTSEFMIFNVSFTDNDTVFVKSKRTGRWWMRMPAGEYAPCAYSDYLIASANDMPERWLRMQERLL